jgi:uncharacterized membrane protein YbhN (UPF0104 family)
LADPTPKRPRRFADGGVPLGFPDCGVGGVEGAAMASVAVQGGGRIGTRLRTGATVSVAVAVGALVIAQRGVLLAGLARLGQADPRWLAPAMASAGLLWVASALTQAGATGPALPFRRLYAVQGAALFADHFLPAGTGGFMVNVRFLRNHGLSGPEAATSVIIRSVAGWVIRVLLLVVLLAGHPQDLLPGGPGLHDASMAELVAAAAVVVAAAVALLARYRSRLPVWWADLREGLAVLRAPRRAAALWAGAVIAPLLHALVLLTVAEAMSVHLSWAHAMVLYLAASTLTGALPVPGAVGAMEVVLVAALVAAGVPGAAAAGTTVAYRMLTVWLPLLPAGVLLALLVRRHVV